MAELAGESLSDKLAVVLVSSKEEGWVAAGQRGDGWVGRHWDVNMFGGALVAGCFNLRRALLVKCSSTCSSIMRPDCSRCVDG